MTAVIPAYPCGCVDLGRGAESRPPPPVMKLTQRDSPGIHHVGSKWRTGINPRRCVSTAPRTRGDTTLPGASTSASARARHISDEAFQSGVSDEVTNSVRSAATAAPCDWIRRPRRSRRTTAHARARRPHAGGRPDSGRGRRGAAPAAKQRPVEVARVGSASSSMAKCPPP